jgi:HEAT repeat protein
LFSLLYDGDGLIRWRAIEGLGRVMGALADRDSAGAARETVRKILWAMNDESGGLIWNGPEAIAEVLANVPSLMEPYAEKLPSYYLEEPFERGAHWAVARLAALRGDCFSGRVDELLPSLSNPDPFIRAFSGLALLRIRGPRGGKDLEGLVCDGARFEHYDLEAGVLAETSVCELIRSNPS